jgi:hypothetical protein
LSLPCAEVQLPEDGELSDQNRGRPHCCGRRRPRSLGQAT